MCLLLKRLDCNHELIQMQFGIYPLFVVFHFRFSNQVMSWALQTDMLWKWILAMIWCEMKVYTSTVLLCYCNLCLCNRNRGISSSLPTLVTVMSTPSCQPKSYMERRQITASVSRYHSLSQTGAEVLISSMLNPLCFDVTSLSSPRSAVRRGTWSCFVQTTSRPGPAGSQPCAC